MGNGPAKKTTRKPATPKAKPAAAAKKVTEKKEPEKSSKPGNAPKKVNNSKDSKAKDSKGTKAKQDVPSFSEAQKRAIYNLSRRRGISVEDLENVIMEDYGKTLDDLSSAEASDLIRSLQQAA